MGAESERAGACARRVDLVVEGEALLDGDAALRELEHAAGRLDEDHLLVALVEEDDALHTREAVVLEQVARDLHVGHARHERARVDERAGEGHEAGHALAVGPAIIPVSSYTAILQQDGLLDVELLRLPLSLRMRPEIASVKNSARASTAVSTEAALHATRRRRAGAAHHRAAALLASGASRFAALHKSDAKAF